MKKQKLPKLKKGAWFYKVRGSYLPATWQGWLTYVPFLTYVISVLVIAANVTDSAAGFIMTIFPQWVAAAVVMTWIAARKS